MCVDGDGATDSSSNSALPTEDSLSAGLLATVDHVLPLELATSSPFVVCDCLIN